MLSLCAHVSGSPDLKQTSIWHTCGRPLWTDFRNLYSARTIGWNAESPATYSSCSRGKLYDAIFRIKPTYCSTNHWGRRTSRELCSRAIKIYTPYRHDNTSKNTWPYVHKINQRRSAWEHYSLSIVVASRPHWSRYRDRQAANPWSACEPAGWFCRWSVASVPATHEAARSQHLFHLLCPFITDHSMPTVCAYSTWPAACYNPELVKRQWDPLSKTSSKVLSNIEVTPRRGIGTVASDITLLHVSCLWRLAPLPTALRDRQRTLPLCLLFADHQIALIFWHGWRSPQWAVSMVRRV